MGGGYNPSEVIAPLATAMKSLKTNGDLPFNGSFELEFVPNPWTGATLFVVMQKN